MLFGFNAGSIVTIVEEFPVAWCSVCVSSTTISSSDDKLGGAGLLCTGGEVFIAGVAGLGDDSAAGVTGLEVSATALLLLACRRASL